MRDMLYSPIRSTFTNSLTAHNSHGIPIFTNTGASVIVHVRLDNMVRVAGISGVEGYTLAVPQVISGAFQSQHIGHMIQDRLTYEFKVNSFEEDTYELLVPFFEKFWAEFGLDH